MEMKNPFGAPVCTRRFSHSTRLPSIRYATVLGGLLAFALLWAVSLRANADVPPGKGVHFQNQVAAHTFEASSGSEAGDSPARLAAGSREVDTTSPPWPIRALVSACLVIILLVGTCCSRVALKRASAKLRVAEDGWRRRYAEAEAREQAARLATPVQAAAAATQERNRVLATVRHFAVAPLTAVSGMLEAFDTTALSPAQRLSIGVIRSAVRTLACALDDVLEPAPLATHAVVLDESVTDLRELINGTVALFASSAALRGVRVSVSID
jgi:signal transduction histidine kinase